MTRAASLIAAAALFVVVATANSGGYRFGISDQAYYGAAIAKAADPSLFPRDAELLDAQSRHMLSDDILGWLARANGGDLPPLFLAVYILTLVALFAGGVFFARRLGVSWWATAAFLCLLTLKHRIAKTGANTLEGYMHPRMLAFALGLAAFGCVLRRRHGMAMVAVAAAAVCHTTTALWFGIAVGVAAFAGRQEWRRGLGVAAAVGGAAGLWMVWLGPMAGRIAIMDPEWVRLLETKDYLFPAAWPMYAWILNLTYPVVLVLALRRRTRLGIAAVGERDLVAGLLALGAIFAVSVPFTAAHLALAVQLQVTRVFWLMDVVVAAYVAWWLADAITRLSVRWAQVVVVAVLLAIALGRGWFVLRVQTDRSLIQMRPAATAWTDACLWLKGQPVDWQVLADPGHAWKYEQGVRLLALKDTFLEAGKDTALALYSRPIAERVLERSAALEGFESLTETELQRLASRYHLVVLLTTADRQLKLPVLYRNSGFVIYDLR